METTIAPINKQYSFFTTTNLKYLAIIAMAIDHIAFTFVPYYSNIGIIMHFIGRITAPIMFYFAVEGYHKTKNLTRYCLRLFVFAAISYFPFVYFISGGDMGYLEFTKFNVIFSILLGVLAIHIRRTFKNAIIKYLLILFIIILSIFCDWGDLSILFILAFDYYYGNFNGQAFAFSLVALLKNDLLYTFTHPVYNLVYDGKFYLDPELIKTSIPTFGIFLALLLLKFYNGKRGSSSNFSKWFFYIFYPVHLLIIPFVFQIILK